MLEQLLLTVLMTSIPLIFAATGELVAERSGVLNLGVEGMMLMGAVSALPCPWDWKHLAGDRCGRGCRRHDWICLRTLR